MRSLLRLALVAVVLAAGSYLSASTAGAAVISLSISTFPSGNPDQLVFDFTIDGDTCADSTEVDVPEVPGATVTLADPNNGTIAFPVGTPGGPYRFTVTCNDVQGAPLSGESGVTFATVTVAKVVTGEVPAGAVFPVTVVCSRDLLSTANTDDFSAEGGGFLLDTSFSFDAAGGSKYLVAYGPQGCTISETDNGGALSSTLDVNDCGEGRTAAANEAGTEATGPSGTFDIVDPTDCTQTITNVFAAPAAQPADVVQQQPAFTG